MKITRLESGVAMIKQNSELMSALNNIGLVITPKGAGHHVSKFFKRKGISVNKAGAVLGVSPSTVARFINGGSLTESMAAKLAKHYQLPINVLFGLEASYHTHNATELLVTA